MKRMKRALALLLCLCMTAAPVLTSCNKTETSDTQSSSVRQFTVSFYADSDATEPAAVKKVDEGSAVDVKSVTEPQKIGYRFGGWTTEKNGTVKYDETAAILSDLSLYPIWANAAETEIKFVTNGGGSLSPLKGYPGDALTLPEPARKYYIFDGWYTDAELTQKYTAAVYPETGLTLYAKWKAAETTVSVTYKLADGSVYDTRTKEKGEKAEDVAGAIAGYVFIGWKDAEGKAYDFNKTLEADLTLYADYYSEGLEVDDGVVTGYSGTSTYVIVPEEYKGENGKGNAQRITVIGRYAFDGVSAKITKVTLPASLTSIEDGAFAGLTYLASVNIPSGIEEFGEGVFEGCSALVEKEVGDFTGNPNYKIENGAFLTADGKELVLFTAARTDAYTVPASVTKIQTGAFVYADIGTLTVPATVTAVNAAAFAHSLIRNVAYSASTAALPAEAFKESAVLEKVTLGASVVKIGASAFLGCEKLSSVTLGASSVALEKEAFRDCILLETFEFSKVASMGADVFIGAGIKSYTIPAGSTLIAAGAFSGWSKLESISVPASVTSVGDYAFMNCSSLKTVEFAAGSKLASVGVSAFAYTGLTSIDLTGCAALTVVKNEAFAGCTALKNAAFPSTLHTLGASALSGCSALENLTLPFAGSYSFEGFGQFFLDEIIIPGFASAGLRYDENTTPQEIEAYTKEHLTEEGRKWYRATLSKDAYLDLAGEQLFTSRMLFGYVFGTTAYSGSQEINQRVSDESYNTFYVPKSLKNITINGEFITSFAFNNMQEYAGTFTFTSNLKKIGYRAFQNLTAIKNYDFSTATSLKAIGNYAFGLNGSLEKVYIPDGIEKIGNQAFSYCKALKEVRLPAGSAAKPFEIDQRAFYDNSALTTIYTTDAERSEGVAKMHHVILNNYSFTNCTALKKVVIDGTLGIRVSFYQTGTDSAGVPTGILYGAAFTGCAGLEEVTMPTVVGETYKLYNDYTDLPEDKYLNYQYSSACLPTNFFSGCPKLTKLNAGMVNGKYYDMVIPDGIDLVGYYAFSNVGFTSVYFPDSVKTLCAGAFRDSSLVKADIGSVTQLASAFMGAKALEEIILSNELAELNQSVFESCTSLRTIGVKKADGTVEKTDGCFIMPENVTYTGSYIFKQTAVETVKLSEKLQVYGAQMFYECKSLKEVTIPAAAKTFNSLIFYQCESLAKITFKGTAMRDIQYRVFEGCVSLKSVVFPEGLTYIAEYCFTGCTNLERVVLPATLAFFSRYGGFESCPALKEVVLLGTTPCQVDSGCSANSSTLFYNKTAKKDNFDTLKANGLKIYIPEASYEAYSQHIANSESVTDKNNYGGSSSLEAQRPEFGWNKYSSAFVTYEKGIYTDFAGHTAAVYAFDGKVWIKDGAAFEELSAGTDGTYTTAAGNKYAIAATGAVSVNGKAMTKIGGTYIDDSYTANNALATDKDAERLIQFRPQLVLETDGRAAMYLYIEMPVSNPAATMTKYKLFIYKGAYTVGTDGTVSARFDEKVSFTALYTGSNYVEESAALTGDAISVTISGDKSNGVTIDSNSYTFTLRG